MNRYQMDMPKIGIRPVIDGRRNGVRESLEDQTMGMALSAKKPERICVPQTILFQCPPYQILAAVLPFGAHRQTGISPCQKEIHNHAPEFSPEAPKKIGLENIDEAVLKLLHPQLFVST